MLVVVVHVVIDGVGRNTEVELEKGNILGREILVRTRVYCL